MNKIIPKLIIKKIIALSLIITSLISIYTSVSSLLLIYPKLILISNPNQFYLELLKKGIIISSSLFIESIYGFSLLIKPAEKTNLIHIILGITLFIFSIFIKKFSTFDPLIKNLLFPPIT